MKIGDLIAPGDVLLDLRASDKRQLLGKLARHLAPALGIDPEAAAAALVRRERLGSTGTGDGIALPHARLPQVVRPMGLLACLRPALDFEAVDGNPVHLVFLVFLPEQERGLGLNVLACVARRLREPELVKALCRSRSREEAYAMFVAERIPVREG